MGYFFICTDTKSFFYSLKDPFYIFILCDITGLNSCKCTYTSACIPLTWTIVLGFQLTQYSTDLLLILHAFYEGCLKHRCLTYPTDIQNITNSDRCYGWQSQSKLSMCPSYRAEYVDSAILWARRENQQPGILCFNCHLIVKLEIRTPGKSCT